MFVPVFSSDSDCSFTFDDFVDMMSVFSEAAPRSLKVRQADKYTDKQTDSQKDRHRHTDGQTDTYLHDIRFLGSYTQGRHDWQSFVLIRH